MYKIGVIGDFENAAYFGAAGFEYFCPGEREELGQIVDRLIKNEYAVIFVSDKYYGQLQNVKSGYLPAIVPLPIDCNLGIGKDRLKTRLGGAVGINFN